MKMMAAVMPIARYVVSFKGGWYGIRLIHSDFDFTFASASNHHQHRSPVLENLHKINDAFKAFNELKEIKPLEITRTKFSFFSIEFFKQMAAIRAPVDPYTIAIAIRCSNHMTLDLAIFGYGFKRGVAPDAIAFGTVLDELILEEDRIREAERFFIKLIKGKLCVPNVVMYDTMIKGLCKIGKNHSAIRLLRQMVENERGFKQQDMITMYTTIIDSICKDDGKMMDDALKLFDEMIFDKGIILPNAITYNSFIRSLCNSGRVNEACKMAAQMEDQGMISSDDAMNNNSTLIDAFCKEGKVETGEAYLYFMIESGMDPNLATYNSVISGFCLQGHMIKANKVFDLMKIRGHVPNVATYSSLLNGYCLTREMKKARAVFDSMVIDGGLVPDVETYNSLLNGYCLQSKMRKARAVFFSMVFKGVIPNITTYNTLLNGYCKKVEDIDEALHLFHDIIEKGMFDVVTFNTMFQGLIRVGRCKDAHEIFNKMQVQYWIKPNACTYRIILEGLCISHQVDEALSLFHLMIFIEHNLDIVDYNILIDGASRCGKLDIAKDVFNELCAKGLHPDAWTYGALINGYLREGLVGEAKELFQKMVDMGCVPNRATYNVLLRGLLENRQHDMVEMLLKEMEGRGFSLDTSTFCTLFFRVTSELDISLLKLIHKLVPKDGPMLPCSGRSRNFDDGGRNLSNIIL